MISPPALRLPAARRRPDAGTAISLLLHCALVLALAWHGADLLSGGGSGPGPRGGGGGGAGPAVRFLQLPAASAPRALDVPDAPKLAVNVLSVPDPIALKLPAIEAPVPQPLAAEMPSAPATTAAGTGGGPGAGPGAGGGQGTGTGPGKGSDVGPGTGGNGSYIFPADTRGLVSPPECAHGRFNVRFWVAADGRVTRVEIDPLPRDAGCRRDFQDRMKAYQFRPARAQDGQPVASIYALQISH